jgi:2-dehydropantoate 2-reductase
MKICVIGAGAMGSVFGGLLARAGNEVVLVDIWREQVAAVNASGLRLSGALGELRTPVRAQETPPAGMGADVAMIWTDANATRDAATSAATVLAPDGFAITLQNGIGNVEALIEVLGAKRVAGGSSMCSAAMYGPGHAGFTHRGVTSIGEIGGGTSERIERLRTALGAPVQAQAHPDIMTRSGPSSPSTARSMRYAPPPVCASRNSRACRRPTGCRTA